MNTAANFAIEPEPLDDWLAYFHKTHEQYPWLIAEDDGRDSHDDHSDSRRDAANDRDNTGNTDVDRSILGFAKASPHRGRCAYAYTAEVSVYVHPEHHGRGIARTLYQRLIPILRKQGYCTLIAGITLPNPASQRLHESFGFTPVGVYRRVGWKFNAWHDVGYWELVLHPRAAAPPNRVLTVAEAMTQTSTPA